MSQHNDCLFCKITQKHYRVFEVYRDDKIMAFLDNGPIRPGHTQIIPLEHYDYFDDLPLELATRIMQLGQHLAKVLKQITGVERVAFLFTGGDIPHAHAHLIPMYEKTDITSRRYILNKDLTFQDRPCPPHNEQLAILRKIKEAMSAEHL